MVAHHIHDALKQIHTMQELVLTKRIFRGYSGTARILSGTAAIIAPFVLSSSYVPDRPIVHLVGWSLVMIFSLALNYSALLYWFLFDPDVRRNPLMIKPALDALPAFGVGAVLSVALVMTKNYDLLFGAWMCLYGLAQTAYRLSMPKGIYRVGLGYIACGAACLLLPSVSFTNPWPMGIVFFAGELSGGYILIIDHADHATDPSHTSQEPDLDTNRKEEP